MLQNWFFIHFVAVYGKNTIRRLNCEEPYLQPHMIGDVPTLKNHKNNNDKAFVGGNNDLTFPNKYQE